MNTTRFARYFTLPIVVAGIIGGAALGTASMASAANNDNVRPPHIVATPHVTAPPAPEAMPGWRNHHGIYQVEALRPDYIR
jgi:hypothetical protein